MTKVTLTGITFHLDIPALDHIITELDTITAKLDALHACCCPDQIAVRIIIPVGQIEEQP